MKEVMGWISRTEARRLKRYVRMPRLPANQKPILRCSICTGEQVAGFKDLHTGKFTDIMLIKDEKDLAAFKKQYGVTEITKEF